MSEEKDEKILEHLKTLELKKRLIKDMGRDGAFMWIMEAKKYLPMLNDLRRILAVAMKM